MKKIILKNIRIMILAVMLTFSLGIAFAFTGPTYAPPVSSVAAPLNVSLSYQTKDGLLIIENNSGNTYGLIIANGAVTVGAPDATPKYTLDVKGSIGIASSLCINGNCKSSWFPAGPIGDKGPAGTNGPVGPKGPTGSTGSTVPLTSCVYGSKTYGIGTVCYVQATYFSSSCSANNVVCTANGWGSYNSSACGTACGK
jgi:hypothetical protein